MLAVLVFVFAKFVAYCAFCSQAPRWFAFSGAEPVAFGVRWGSVRLLIGIVAGFPIAFIFGMSQEARLPLFLSYAVSFAPMRYLEWFVLFKLITAGKRISFGARANA